MDNVDTARLVDLEARGLSRAEIGTLVGMPTTTVHNRLAKVKALVQAGKQAEEYRQNRAQILSGLQAGLLDRVHECLEDETQREKISPYQAVGMFGILYDKERLETGRSTQNVNVLSTIIEQVNDDDAPAAPIKRKRGGKSGGNKPKLR